MNSAAHGNSSGQRMLIVGCGYIGAAVAERAIAQGVHVTALTRNAQTAVALRAGGIESIVADVTTEKWYGLVPSKPDFLLNCLSGGSGGLEGYRHSYVRGMESVLRWAHTHGPVGTFVYTSSTSVYPQDGGVSVGEESTVGVAHQDRAGILLDAEDRLSHCGPACGRWFILRLAGIYGPGRHHLLDQVKSGQVAGSGEHHLNLAHRDDIVSAIWACFLASPSIRNETFNVVDDRPARKTEIVTWLAHELRLPAPSFTGTPVAGRRAITPDRVILNRKLKSILGWAPRFQSYEDGYRAILQS